MEAPKWAWWITGGKKRRSNTKLVGHLIRPSPDWKVPTNPVRGVLYLSCVFMLSATIYEAAFGHTFHSIRLPACSSTSIFVWRRLSSCKQYAVKHQLVFGWQMSLYTSGLLLLLVLEPASPRENHGDVAWVVSTPRSPVPASLHLLVLQLKPSLSGLRAPEYPLFAPSLLVLIQVTKRGRRGVLITPPFVGQ